VQEGHGFQCRVNLGSLKMMQIKFGDRSMFYCIDHALQRDTLSVTEPCEGDCSERQK
jgi:hypothetical protein